MNYNLDGSKKGSAEYENMKASILEDLKTQGYTTKKDIAKGAKAQLDELLKPCKVKKGGSEELVPLMKTYAQIFLDIIEENKVPSDKQIEKMNKEHKKASTKKGKK